MKTKFFNFVIPALMLGILTSCGSSPSSSTQPEPVGDPSIALGNPGENIKLLTNTQQWILDNYTNTSFPEYGVAENSRPNPVNLTWVANNLQGCDKYTIKISEDSSMSNPITYETSSTSFSLYNCKMGTKYYWTVTGNDTKTTVSDVGSFSTAQAEIRNLYIDGVTNVRDIGGKNVGGHQRIKQNMLFRGGRLSSQYGQKAEVSEQGIDALRKLGLKTELDLRRNIDTRSASDIEQNRVENGELTKSVVGEDINYVSVPHQSSSNVANPARKAEVESLKKLFETLADKENYPMYFHCSIGTDRTGGIAYVLGALLGVAKEDLQKDYVFSMMGAIFKAEERASKSDRTIEEQLRSGYVQRIDNAAGSTLAEKTKNHLISLGVDVENINKFISYMLEEQPMDNATNLEIGTNSTAFDNPGKWLYKWKNSAVCATFSQEPFSDGNSIGFTIDTYTPSATPENDIIYLFIQPKLDVGTKYNFKGIIWSNKATPFSSSSISMTTTPYTFLPFEAQNTVSASSTLTLTFKFNNGLQSGSIVRLSNIEMTPIAG